MKVCGGKQQGERGIKEVDRKKDAGTTLSLTSHVEKKNCSGGGDRSPA